MMTAQGFETVQFSEVRYISIEDAVKTFKYLSDFPRKGVYIRNSVVLSKEEQTEYRMMLTIPKTATEFYLRVWNAFYVYEYEGALYLLNGNSRMWSLTDAYENSNTEIADIPYILIQGELSDDQIRRFQIDSNDRTRNHRAIDKLRQIYGFVTRSVEAGVKESTARKYAAGYFGVTQQSLSNAKKICSPECPQILTKLLDEDQIRTDAAKLVLDAVEILLLDINVVLDAVIKHAEIDPDGETFVIGANDVKRWRRAYEANTAYLRAKDETVEGYIAAGVKDPRDALLLHIDDSGEEIRYSADKTEVKQDEAVEIDREGIANSNAVQLLKVGYTPQKLGQLTAILGTLATHLDASEGQQLFNTVLALVQDAAKSDNIPSELLPKLQNTLRMMQ